MVCLSFLCLAVASHLVQGHLSASCDHRANLLAFLQEKEDIPPFSLNNSTRWGKKKERMKKNESTSRDLSFQVPTSTSLQKSK